MQTRIAPVHLASRTGQEADQILRSCVHCGFCAAVCPTYQLLGDELDGPRGRIYLIKQMLEEQRVTSHTRIHRNPEFSGIYRNITGSTSRTRIHLDRCLLCRACESSCPSGVRYGRLLEIGRELIEKRMRRPVRDRWFRRLLRLTCPYPTRLAWLLKIASLFSPLLPARLRRKLPAPVPVVPRPTHQHRRKMVVLEGCVQSVATPHTNAAAARLLNRLGIDLISAPGAGCCGALSHHLAAPAEALNFMRANIDAWWPWIEKGAEAILITASGCTTMIREYGELLREDPDYSERAQQISALVRDASEVLRDEDLTPLCASGQGRRIAFHSPCTLQHGLRLGGVVEDILDRVGFERVPITDAHLCCGSGGSYSLTEPVLAAQILEKKVAALQQHRPQLIATANVGCQLHLASGADLPVIHWLELLEQASADIVVKKT